MSEARVTVLMIDDEEKVREVTSAMLEAAGFEIQTAADGPSALARLDAGERFDVILLDQSMPGMDGADVAREIWARLPAQPIVLASGYGDPGPSAGGTFASVLPKPFGMQELLTAVRTAAGAGTGE